jgi:signal transduction histidine kinase
MRDQGAFEIAPEKMDKSKLAAEAPTTEAAQPQFPLVARVYVTLVVLAGLMGALHTFQSWTPQFSTRLILYFLISIASSGMKVVLPNVNGNLSVNYLLTLLALLELGTPSAMLLALAATVVQTLWRPKRHVRIIQFVFNLACMVLTVSLAGVLFNQPWFRGIPEGQALRLAVAGVGYFFVNTLCVSTVIGLSEGRAVRSVWTTSYGWALPYYLVGVSFAVMLHASMEQLGWRFIVALVPLLYVVYRSFRLYLDGLEQDRAHRLELLRYSRALATTNEELSIALDEARRANKLKSRFLASVSHELRTPLNGIIGFAQMFYDGLIGPVDEIQRECLGDMLGCANHLHALIGNVLDLTKAEAGKMDLRYEPVSLSPLIREVIDTQQPAASLKGITVSFEQSEQVEVVTVDTVRLKQILYNFLSNAVKFTRNGGRIWISVSPEGDKLYRIDIADNGVGIAADDLPNLFSEFGQVGESEKSKEGSGLGLAISKHIAEALGGRVGVESTLGAGSKFFVVLPIIPQHCADSQEPARPVAGVADSLLSSP